MRKVHFGDIKVMWQLQREDANKTVSLTMVPGTLKKLLELIEGWSGQVQALCLQSVLTNSAQGRNRVLPLQMI